MLSKLTIDNYALIDKSEIDFPSGFTVITGETGSGKSIMLDALSLLTGARADSKSLGNKERKMVVEAIFSNPPEKIKSILEEQQIDWDPEQLIIRREISKSGKSRGYINDDPVNLTVLSSVASNLIDIHSQHNNSLLNKPQEQLNIIDAYGNTIHILEDYRKSFKEYVSLRNRLKKIKEGIAQGKENKEFILFRLEQLDKLKPKRGELFQLEKESELLGDADKIKSEIAESVNILEGGAHSVMKLLQTLSSIVDNIDFSLFDPKEEDQIAERLSEIKIELRDISDTLQNYSEGVSVDPVRYEKVTTRIEAINEAMRRFKVKSEDELVELHEKLKEELSLMSEDMSNIPEMESKLKNLAKILKEKADQLSELRTIAAENFSSIIAKKIMPLGMPNIRFEAMVEKGRMTPDGQDLVTFYCSFNKNHPMQPISEIASGGEISRVMLGIKSVMSEVMNMPTVIFDEIDTGVSGEIAHKMGKMMKSMSGNGKQVFSVTHLPQVAVSGDYHLKVQKHDEEGKTISQIKSLNTEERVREIAGMLSGTTINDVALQNARILLEE